MEASFFRKCENFRAEHGERLVIFLTIIVIGAICFEVGFSRGKSRQIAPMIIEVPAKQAVSDACSSEAPKAVSQKSVSKLIEGSVAGAFATAVESPAVSDACAFVGSRNSDKYHIPTCAVVKRIKPENKVCFSSEDDAKTKGYVAGCVQ